MVLRILYIACLLQIYFLAYGQSPELYERYGDNAIEERNAWHEAFGFYKQAYALDSGSMILRQKLAHAAREVKYYPLALELYTKNYEVDEGKTDPDALYYMAGLEKVMGRYEDAQRNFKKYTKKYKATADRKLMAIATHEVKSSQWALVHENKHEQPDSLFSVMIGGDRRTVNWKKNRLPSNIISAESELAPFQTAQTFYYSEYAEEKWRIRMADVAHDSLQVEIKPPGFLNIREVPGLPSGEGAQANFSQVGDRIYYSQVNDSFTQLMTGSWDIDHIVSAYVMDVLNDEGTINTMPHYAVIDGKEYLFFVSNRSGGEGGLDIWFSLNENGWKKPKNAGKRVNSEGDEITPFYHNGMLFFSSDWHFGFGGFDLFYANRKGESFDKPVNMGLVINSSYNDLSPAIAVSKAKDRCDFYFASNKPDSVRYEAACCNDLYVVSALTNVQTIRTDTVQSVLNKLMSELPVVLYFHNDEPNPKSNSPTTELSYLETYASYTAKKDYYIRENTRGLTNEKREDSEQRTQDFFELKVDKGVNDLKRFSDALLAELNTGLSFRVYVRGFASPRANSDYNLNLTKRRTTSLLNYFKQAQEGAFLPYLNDTAPNHARLEIILLPFGEGNAVNTVSDDIVDERESIYSRGASMERRIEIEEVVSLAPPILKPVLELTELQFDFGKLEPTEAARHEFVLINSGNAVMTIDSVSVSCDCVSAQLDGNIVAPGESAILLVEVNPKEPGEFQQEIVVHIAGEKPGFIRVRAER